MAETKKFKLNTLKYYYNSDLDMCVYDSPLADCQTFSIGNFCSLFNHELTDAEILLNLREIYKDVVGKKQLLCNVKNDIEYDYKRRIEALCKSTNAIVFKQEYTSSNGNQMVMFLINISKLFVTKSEKKKLRDKNDRIGKIMELYESSLLTRKNIPYHLGNYTGKLTNDNISLENFLVRFFSNYNNHYYTYDNTASYVCDNNRRRSLGDIYLICKEYYPNCTLKDIIKILIFRLENGLLSGSYCNMICKFVFHLQSDHYNSNNPVEYDKSLTFKDVVDYYKQKN